MNVRVLTLFDDDPVVPSNPPAAKKAVSKKRVKTAEKEIHAVASSTVKAAPGPAAEDKMYYSIGEIAKLFAVRTSHIRFWTVQFALKVRTTRKGDRLYNQDNIEQLKQIHQLVKVQGFTIAGAKTKLKEKPQHIEVNPTSSAEVLHKAQLLSILHEVKQTLIQLRNQIR